METEEFRHLVHEAIQPMLVRLGESHVVSTNAVGGRVQVFIDNQEFVLVVKRPGYELRKGV